MLPMTNNHGGWKPPLRSGGFQPPTSIKKTKRFEVDAMNNFYRRREFLSKLGVSAAALPFVTGLPAVMGAEPVNVSDRKKKQRVIVMFSPNGVVQKNYWPETAGPDFEMTPILQPLADFKDKMLLLHGVSNKVRGDGDSHMRGMSCLLTGTELLPGNIQGCLLYTSDAADEESFFRNWA